MTDSAAESQTDGENGLVDGGKVMPLMEHLGELRVRIVRALIFMLVLFAVFMGYAEQVIDFLKGPLIYALPEGSNSLHFTGPMDVFMAQIKVAILGALIFASPVWIYQLWRFCEPALYPQERKYVLPFVFSSVVLFFAGVSFCFFIIIPLAMEFLIGMGTATATAIITINDYVSLLMILVLGFGVVFQTPVILVLLALLDIITADAMAEYRKFVVVIILIVGALLTPPDPISQLAMAIPIYIMYEASIVIIRAIKGRPAKPATS